MLGTGASAGGGDRERPNVPWASARGSCLRPHSGGHNLGGATTACQVTIGHTALTRVPSATLQGGSWHPPIPSVPATRPKIAPAGGYKQVRPIAGGHRVPGWWGPAAGRWGAAWCCTAGGGWWAPAWAATCARKTRGVARPSAPSGWTWSSAPGPRRGGAGGRWTLSTGRRWSIAGRRGCWSSDRPGGCSAWGAWGAPSPSTSCPTPARSPCPSSPPRTCAEPNCPAPSPAPCPTKPRGAEGDGGPGMWVGVGGRRMMLGGNGGARTPGSTRPPRRGSAGGWGRWGWGPARMGPPPCGRCRGGRRGRRGPGSTGGHSISLAKRRGCKDGEH